MREEVRTERGLGLAAALPREVIERAAGAAQGAGYRSFWLNNPPGGTALESLGRVAGSVHGMRLGVGVIPLSHHSPEGIVSDVRRHRVPVDRLYLGIGSGAGPGGVRRVAEGIHALRAELECTLVVAALGPRMCRLAGEEADGVLLNWLTPRAAETSIEWIREGAERRGRPLPRVMAYVRVAVGRQGGERLRQEADHYASIPNYAEHFARMHMTAMDTAILGNDAGELQGKLWAWDGIVNDVVVRAVPAHDTVEDVLTVLEAAAPPS